MQIQNIAINEIFPFPGNPRINEKSIIKVKKSIEKFGFNQPIVVDQNYKICVGHTRWQAAKLLKLESVPVYVKEMTKKQFLAYNIADNRTSQDSLWDEKLLTEQLLNLNDLDEQILDFVGFDEKELEAILDFGELDDLLEDSDEIEHKGKDKEDIEKSHVKMIQIFYDEIEYKEIIEMAEKMQEKLQTKNLSDTVYRIVKGYYDAFNKN